MYRKARFSIHVLIRCLENSTFLDSQDLLNNLFCHPYTKIEFLERDLGVSRLTAVKYLDQLCEKDFLVKHKMGRTNYYINEPLAKLLMDNGR